MARLPACKMMFVVMAALALGCANEPPTSQGPPGDADQADERDQGVVDQGEDTLPDAPPDLPQDPQPDVTPDTPVDQVEDGAWPSCVYTGNEVCDNGFDDNCNGRIDEGCTCSPLGFTQYCYPGDPAHLSAPNTTCQRGLQTCEMEFWGECEGAIGPEPTDYCGDLLDNNCNGTIDEGCGITDPVATCPADFTGPVLNRYTLLGSYSDPNSIPMASAIWSMLSAPPGHSYDVTTSGLELTFFADVTGDYRFRLTVQNTSGGTDSCETLFTATTEDILRIELTWNRPEGEEYFACPSTDKTDLDLHLRRVPTGDYCYYHPNYPTVTCDDNCFWDNCATCDRTYDDLGRERYCRDFISDPPPGVCTEGQPCPPPMLHWGSDSNLFNDPRLDLDDVDGCGPENINIREPDEGVYRVAVHFYDPYEPADSPPATPLEATARVRILCQGQQLDLTEAVTLSGYSARRSEWYQNDFWEVGDITIDYDVTPPDLPCTWNEFGSEGDRRICTYSVADPGGCPP